MASIFFSAVSLHLRLKMSSAALQSEVAAAPEIVGEHMAQALMAYEREHHLSYFPALDYFRGRDDFDQELINAIDGVAWIACQQTRALAISKLRPAFTNLEIDSIQSEVHLMPAVRPRQPNTFLMLAQHFTPDSVKIVLRVSLLQKQPGTDGLESYARKMAWKWLSNHFESVEVIQAKLLGS